MRIFKGHTGSIKALAYSPDGRTLASGSEDCKVRIWDLANGRSMATLEEHTESVTSIAHAPTGDFVVSGSLDGHIHLWGKDPNEASRWSWMCSMGYGVPITSLSVSPDAQMIAFGQESNRNTVDGSLGFGVNRGTSWQTERVGGHHATWGVAFAPEGKQFASGHPTGNVVIHEFHRHSRPARTSGVPFPSTNTGFTFRHSGSVREVIFSPDQRYLAVMTGRRVVLWNLSTREVHLELGGHQHYVWSIAFTPDGRSLVTGSWDGVVRVWDVESGVLRAQFDWNLGRINSVAVSPDGMTAAVGGTGEEIIIWDLDDA